MPRVIRAITAISSLAIWPLPLFAFTNTVVLTIRQGETPATNGAPIVGAAPYTNTVDTYIHSLYSNTAFGTSSVCIFGGSSVTGYTRAYLRFDRLEDFVPSKARIIAARLYLTSAGDWLTGGYGSGMYYMQDNWSDTVTWNTRPPDGQVIGTVNREGVVPKTNGSVIALNVSSLAQAWHQGSIPNYGIHFRCAENQPYSGRSFHSSEADNLSNRPLLEITYAAATEVAPNPVWPGREGWLRLVVTNGPGIWSDTYISSNHLNYATAPIADIRTYNSPDTPRRALLRLEIGSLPQIARSDEPLRAKVARLMGASLQISTRSMNDWGFTLWTCAATWEPTLVTDLTRDGTNAWAEIWGGTYISNVSQNLGSQSFDSAYRGGSLSWDIKNALQAWIDGSPNTGFVLGHASGAAYLNEVALTEFGIQHMRPTLILQTWTPVFNGAIVVIK